MHLFSNRSTDQNGSADDGADAMVLAWKVLTRVTITRVPGLALSQALFCCPEKGRRRHSIYEPCTEFGSSASSEQEPFLQTTALLFLSLMAGRFGMVSAKAGGRF